MIPTKNSYGIILFNKNEKANIYQVLLVQKRYTYTFFDIVHSKIKFTSKNLHLMSVYLEKMTHEELLLLYSMDFKLMWQKIWIDHATRYEEFEHMFRLLYGCLVEHIRRIILVTIPKGELVWELPKGRKERHEDDIKSAAREVFEETKISQDLYEIVPNITRKVTYINDKVKYVCNYYIAIVKKLPTSVYAIDLNHSREVNAIKWFNMEEVRFVDTNNYITKIVKPMLKIIKKYNNGKYVITAPLRSRSKSAIRSRSKVRSLSMPRSDGPSVRIKPSKQSGNIMSRIELVQSSSEESELAAE